MFPTTYNPDTVCYLIDLLYQKPRQHVPITPARVYNANMLPTNNLCKNLRSNLYNNLRNNPDLQIAPLINSNSHLFLHIHLTSFRRFSVEGDFKTLIIPKIAIKVATSVI